MPFMKLGDIKGEFAPSRQVDRDPGDNFHGNAAGDPLPTEEIIRNHGNRTNWDAICDVGTSIKQTSVADALTNYRPEGFSEVENHFATENLDSRLINHDDFLLVNNVGSVPKGPGGTSVFTENVPSISGPGGTSYFSGYSEAIGLDMNQGDPVTASISCEDGDIRLGQFGHEADHFTNFAMPVGDFI